MLIPFANTHAHMHRRKHKASVFKLIISFVGLLALTVGSGDNAREILEESITPLSQAFKSGSESSKIASVHKKLNKDWNSFSLQFFCWYYETQLFFFLMTWFLIVVTGVFGYHHFHWDK